MKDKIEALNRAMEAGDLPQAKNIAGGIDPAAVSEWWAPGFNCRQVSTAAARLLVERGAKVTAHAAAGLGLTDRLAEMLKGDPTLVDSKGGDGCTPLHFARDVETARLLLDAGANLDARDEDHDSTPAQWTIKDAPEVTRLLLQRGAQPDIFLAAGLGDGPLAEKLVDAGPTCLAFRIGRAPDFPAVGYKGRGGTIYQWTLGFNRFPHQIAADRGFAELADYLWQRSDVRTRFLVACVTGKRPEAKAIAKAHPALLSSMEDADLELPARYCWETNPSYDAVKLMLDVGFPVAHPEHNHGYSPLHNAAWAGAGDLVELLIERGHPVDLPDPGHKSTPLGWALYCCLIEKRHPQADYARVVRALVNAGASIKDVDFPTGNAGIDEVLRPHFS